MACGGMEAGAAGRASRVVSSAGERFKALKIYAVALSLNARWKELCFGKEVGARTRTAIEKGGEREGERGGQFAIVNS